MGFLDGVWDNVQNLGDMGKGLFSHPGDAQRDEGLQGKGKGYLGANPYQSGWDALISQLQERASGKNSLAERQVRDVAASGQNQQAAMTAGRGAGAARAGALGAAKITQGLENSAGEARMAEMNQAEGSLQNALGGAGQAQFNRDSANQQAYMGFVHDAQNQQSTLQQVASVAGPVIGAAGGAGAFGKGTSPAQAAPMQWNQQPGYQATGAPGQNVTPIQAGNPHPFNFADSLDEHYRNRNPYNQPGQPQDPYGPRF